ncbi:cupin-like domain-containing protein [Streptomyces sclerotialus]|uniref:cupin-like domain-containing protein n=1 Tax=Streptomyces sclerotialus TaxID=1957 RepID=UPI000689E38C
MNDTASAYHGIKSVPYPRLSLDEFLTWGTEAIIKADTPAVIDVLPPAEPGFYRTAVLDKLGDATVALVKKDRSKENETRAEVTKIPLRDYFEKEPYASNTDGTYRIVSNIKHYSETISELLEFDTAKMFNYQAPLNSANIWANYGGMRSRNHFDDLENFNIQLEGRKRFVVMPPGFKNYYVRSALRGYANTSKSVRVDNVDLRRFPRIAAALAERRDVVLEPGQMLYLPVGWWHQVDAVDGLNININFWLYHRKMLRRPLMLADSLYKVAFRKVNGLYNIQPEKSPTGGKK